MDIKLEFNTYEEFVLCLQNKEWEIIKHIVPNLIEAYNKKDNKYVHTLEAYIKENDPYWIDVTFITTDIPEVLSNCLDSCIKYEQYEWCAEIKKILDNNVRNFPPNRVMSGTLITF
ncbi:MAG: hypothetical protein H3C45_12125 [Bacteroidia bacterium]|nr:hypothetical protein [Bacteroidia bacterium]